MKRPECAGWHANVAECDGNNSKEAPACAYRWRCKILTEIAGGQVARTRKSVAKTVKKTTEEEVTKMLHDQKIMGRFTVRATKVVRHDDCGQEINVFQPPPVYALSVPVARVIAESYASELGLNAIIDEGPWLKEKDVYLRYLPGHNGRQATLYEFDPTFRHSSHGVWITRINMFKRQPLCSLKVNCDDYDGAIFTALPPSGLRCSLWKDVRPFVSLPNVGADKARKTGMWLAKLRKANLIGPRSVRERNRYEQK